MENNIIEFSIPGFSEHMELNYKLLSMMHDEPHKFYEDIKITSVYGAYPTILNGGRPLRGDFEIKEVKNNIKLLNSLGIRARWTFTNLLVDENSLLDPVANAILRCTTECQTIKNDVNIASPLLKKYIEEKYPDLNIVWSTTLCMKEPDIINEYSKKDIVVVDYTINNNFEVLNQLTNKENIEILVNEACKSNCLIRKNHYLAISEYNMFKRDECMTCVYPAHWNYYRSCVPKSHYVDIDNIRTNYLSTGINKFKINGRSQIELNVVESYVNYFVKPEYRDEIRFDLIAFLFHPEAHVYENYH